MVPTDLYNLKIGDIFIAQDSYGSDVYRVVRFESPSPENGTPFVLVVGQDFNGEENTFGYSLGNSHYAGDFFLVGHLDLPCTSSKE